jgi:uncharacterized membrane protein
VNIFDFVTQTEFGRALSTFLMAMVPVIELRGAIPYGVLLGLPIWVSALAAMLGNLVPVPFIVVFARGILRWMKRKSERLRGLAARLERRARGRRLYRSELVGLAILVAIPLPGTGAWTGALVAALLGLRLRAAFPVILIGVVVAGIVVTMLTYGLGAML